MFDHLSEKLNNAFKKLRGKGKLTEADLKVAFREVRLALLEADVNYKVVKDFLDKVTEQALGQQVMKSLTPGQQVVKIVYEELTALMGGENQALNLTGKQPYVIMLVGLQGSGKTTTAGKLALYLTKQGHKPYLVPADVNRPAAIAQLTKIGADLNIPVYPSTTDMNPVDIASSSLNEAVSLGRDVILIDTAGRLSIDEPLMAELKEIQQATSPVEVLFVADAMTGQEAVNIAVAFNEKMDLSGVILSKSEGDARGGAAMSIKAVLGKPLKFVGVGEKSEDLEPFHPDRAASSILGMGDVLTLIEKAQDAIDEEEAMELAKKVKKGDFTLEDFQKQIKQLKNLGSIESILGMIPGLGKLKKLKQAQPDKKELVKIEAIISSMTVEERRNSSILDSSRRKRIAKGSGTNIADVNQLIKNFNETKKMMQRFSKGGLSAFKNALPFK